MTKDVTGRDAPCRGQSGGWITRLGEQLASVRGPPSGARQECPYALTLGYDRIVAGLGLQQSDLQRLLAGKLVLLGGQFRASNDWVESPVHGEAPGVHYHAMAIDNLVEDGADYRRSGNQVLDSDMLKSLLDRRAGVLRRHGRDGAQQPLGPRDRDAGGAEAARAGLRAALFLHLRRLDRRRLAGDLVRRLLRATARRSTGSASPPACWVSCSTRPARRCRPTSWARSNTCAGCDGAWRRFDFSVTI